MDNWNFSVNVKFAEQFDFSKYLRLRILSFTLMLYCQLQFPIDNYPWATDHAIENVILHSERNQFKQLIDQTHGETGKCQVSTWISAHPTTEAESVETTGRERIEKSPYNRRHITILLGKTSELYYIRINLTDANEKWFSGHISITTDGRAFSDIGENPFRARGVRIIPTKPVIKRKVTQFDVHLYGIAFRKDIHQFDSCIRQYTLAPEGGPTLPEQMTLFNRSYIHVTGTLIVCHPVPELATFAYPKMKCTGLVVGSVLTWFDLGPMVSQVITYQSDDKRYFALGPERNSIVSTRDLTGRWIGITVSEYRKYIDGNYHENAT
ncbi:hypothetical protein FGIG_06619 [Fasciola gigantica]|uniref:F5/8 type C domain-containing protein n=1 Tax=Fasciola gigantica TaxID=46835 RepID=A0A504YFJ4_FASGI|nr:hypothetical protein FGIG_06619 [Fasciola gigantica]